MITSYILASIAFIILFLALRSLHMDVQTILSQIATVSADLDLLIAKQAGTPADMQPIADALTALDDKIKTATAT